MKLLFSLEAIGSMLVESYKGNNDFETGGIMIGPKQFAKVVTDIIPSTSYAERKPTTYFQSEKDVKILNQRLGQYQANGDQFRGYFHRHPIGVSTLSSGDISTCSEILQSPNYKIDNFLIMCIITESPIQNFPLFSYALSLNTAGRVTTVKTTYSVLPKILIKEFTECFEPIKKGIYHESINTGQGAKRTQGKTKSDTIRNQGKPNNNNKLPEINVRA